MTDAENIAICEFNFAPLDYVHDSWLSTLPDGDLLAKLRSSRRVKARLSRHLLSQLKLEGHYWFDFGQPGARLTLLDSEQLLKLVFYCGLTLDATRVQQTVLRQEVLRIKNAIGEPGYQFALKRAPHIGPLPASLVPQDPYSNDFYRHATICGTRCLGVAVSRFNRALTHRLLLKLPAVWQEVFEAATQTETADALPAAELLERVAAELELQTPFRSEPPSAS